MLTLTQQDPVRPNTEIIPILKYINEYISIYKLFSG